MSPFVEWVLDAIVLVLWLGPAAGGAALLFAAEARPRAPHDAPVAPRPRAAAAPVAVARLRRA